MTAWYRHAFPLGEATTLGLTGGLVDATAWLDDNALANDEVGQFMNDAFVNSPVLNLPSYDLGVAAVLDHGGRWSARGVWMRSRNVDPENGLDRDFDYLGGQVGLRTKTGLGEGNWRLAAYVAGDDFAAATGGGTEGLAGLGVSVDQRLGDAAGVFARVGWQDDAAAVAHDVLVSGGLVVAGKRWGRPGDAAGVAYAWLDGGSAGLDATGVFEGYVKLRVTGHLALTLDVQHVDDDATGGGGPSGWIYGARVSAGF